MRINKIKKTQIFLYLRFLIIPKVQKEPPRNAVEAVILVILLGYPELMLIPMPGTIRIVVMTVTLLPTAIVAMMGIDGYSLFQYLSHIVRYMITKRKLHFRRVGYHYDPKQLRKKKKSGKAKKKTGKA